MRKTFCDLCGAECVNTSVTVSAETRQHTSRGEQVSYSYTKPAELCLACYRPVRDLLGLTEVVVETDELAMAAPMPVMMTSSHP